ncbi:MAG: acyl-CoA dehydrogenase, partial [Bacteroidetes bacterium RIFOXYA2_FULL_33_7]
KFHITHPLMKRIVELRERNFTEKEKYDYAPLDFEDAIDSYENIMSVFGEICADTLAVNAESVDIEGPSLIDNRIHYAKGTVENIEALKKAGLMGFTLPRKYGGLNMPITLYAMTAELISRGDASFSNIYGLQDIAETINEFASQEIKDIYLPRFVNGETGAMVLTEPDAGSDLQRVQLTATYSEKDKIWYLNGVKRFITNGDAEVSLVLARTEEGTSDGRGLSMLLYVRDNTRTIRRIEEKLGIHGSPTAEMVFKNSPAILIGDRKLGLIKYVMALMNAARLGIGGQSVGLCEAACREAEKYASERMQFGKAIIEFPAMYEMLSNMKAKTMASRALFYETARLVDVYKIYHHIEQERQLFKEEKEEAKTYQRLADVFTPLLKAVSSEYSNQIAYDAIQIHGGTGFMKDFPVERIYRDARITSIYEGTTQLQVVAAIRGVETGAYLKRIEEYSARAISHSLNYLKSILLDMTNEYSKMVELVREKKDNEYTSFHARRLVEMAGNIIMGYLVLDMANQDVEYKELTEVFIKLGKAENKQKAEYILNSDIKDLGIFKNITQKAN